MFQSLSSKLSAVFDKIRGRGLLTEEALAESLREIRVALLEADVALPVAKDFCEKIKEAALGREIIRSISPGQMIVKIVHEELIKLLSSPEDEALINLKAKKPIVYLMVGLQGSGKTTTSGKIAHFIEKNYKKRILLASLDIYRPAAQEQLKIIAAQIKIDVLPIIEHQSVEDITKRALHAARIEGYDLLILDTAGRLHIDETLMQEVKSVKEIANPTETLLVVDSMTGQDAAHIAQAFSTKIGITGTVLTRIDGDNRGGAALSMKFITQKPIKLIGFGEKLDALEAFDAARIAGRILDMGDIVSLVEKAQAISDNEDADKLAKKMQSGQFDLNDLLKQIQQMKKMGGMDSMLNLLPGMGKIKSQLQQSNINEKMFDHQVAIIYSMTPFERRNPKILNASRKRRIAKGSGTTSQEINKLLKQYEQMHDMMKRVKKMGLKGAMMSQFSKMMQR
jgi:signal recognition particle subunit SRP54